MVSGNDGIYLLITPVKDEKQYMGSCIESVLDQTLPPVLWVIVDDGSSDGTVEVVRRFQASNSWIELVSLSGGEWDLGIHYSEVCVRGFDHILRPAADENINWAFIGLLDADITLRPDYFKNIIIEFNSDEKLGIASGMLKESRNGISSITAYKKDRPMGGARLWRRQCFNDAPYIITYAPDSVSNIKAHICGWKIRLFPDISGEQMRAMGASQGRCRGAAIWGKSGHFVGSKPLFAFFKGLKLLSKFPFYLGFCYWKGYFVSYLMRNERIKDRDILHYYGKRKLWDIWKDSHSRI